MLLKRKAATQLQQTAASKNAGDKNLPVKKKDYGI